MKRIILLILVVVFATALFGQKYNRQQSYAKAPVFGVKGGLNVSQIAGDDAYASSDPNWGFHLGALMQYNLMRTVYFQPELLYTQKGYQHQYTALGVDTKVEDSYNYLELPLILKVSFAVPGVRIQPYAGLALGVLLNAKSKITETIGSTSVTHTEKISDDMKMFDAGFTLGADVILTEAVMLGARYNFGLAKIYKDSMPNIGSDVQNGVFMLSVGYLFSRHSY